MDNKTLIEINDLEIKHEYSNKRIVLIPKFSIAEGEIVFINGKNGSGKSTLIRTLFSKNNKPSYSYPIGEKLMTHHFSGTEEDFINKHVTLLSQTNDPMSNMSIYESISYPSKISIENCSLAPFKTNKKEIIDQLYRLVDQMLLECEFDETHLFYDLFDDERFYKSNSKEQQRKYVERILKSKRTDRLSGGQTKLVAFLAAVVKTQIMESSLLVMDEPLNNIDLNKMKRVSGILSDLIDRRKIEKNPLSLLIVSHLMAFSFLDLPEVSQYKIDLTTRELIEDIEGVNHSAILNDM
jgi:ABC-type glutathione transport system ATPase component